VAIAILVILALLHWLRLHLRQRLQIVGIVGRLGHGAMRETAPNYSNR